MKILGVEKGSVGEEIGMREGGELLEFDGRPVTDIIDYEFYNACENFSVKFTCGGKETVADVEKYEDESLGLVLEEGLTVRECRNKCVFCFVDQLPEKELRDALYVKDDDYRHSFLYGTYITLTNLSDEDIERIIRLRISPLYISVHSTDESIRRKMLGIKKSREILPLLEKLKNGGITLYTQIVYCPGYNDDLEASIIALSKVSESLAVVPVGLTEFSKNNLTPVTKDVARKVVSLCERLGEGFLKKTGSRFVFAADELYIKAEAKIPEYSFYEDFSQIENGVGLCALFLNEFEGALREADIKAAPEINVSAATGKSAYPLIKSAAESLAEKSGGKINIAVYEIENGFFGNSVTVSGLITGGDLYNQLKDKPLYDRLILPKVMLKEFNDVFLDNLSVGELSVMLKTKIQIANASGEGFVRAVLGA